MITGHPMFRPTIFFVCLAIAIVLAVVSLFIGSYCEVHGKMKSPAAFWFFGLFSGFIIGALTVIGTVMAFTR